MTKISTQLFIDGTWSEGAGAPFASRNPGNGEVVWEGASAAVQDVERAVLSARRAFASWSALTLDERIAITRRFAALLTENKETLAHTIGRETGRAVWCSRAYRPWE